MTSNYRVFLCKFSSIVRETFLTGGKNSIRTHEVSGTQKLFGTSCTCKYTVVYTNYPVESNNVAQWHPRNLNYIPLLFETIIDK